MRQALLVSVAAIALAAGSTLALSQGGGQGQGSGGAGGAGVGAGGSINAGPSGPSGGAVGGAAGSMRDSQPMEAPGARKGAQERTAPSQKSTQQERMPGAQQRQTESPVQQRQTESPQQGKQGAQSGDTKGQGTKQGAGQRSMTSSNVSLTTEQKTTIRNTVISSGPRVASVNFDINVGVVVPRTVRVAPVPVTLVEIQPAWRGYMYFVYADEIIIVEPRTLKIVAVLEV